MNPAANSKPDQPGFPQPLDRVAIVVILILVVLIGLLLGSGERSLPKVRDFTWQDKQVGAEDRGFILTFNRPMDHASVEANLRITPDLPGKPSWAGRRMAYTLTAPAPYGTAYEVRLQDAKDRFAAEVGPHGTLAPFAGRFRTRDRAFAYIGVTGEEEGRLILFNMTTQQKQILTPKNLMVMDFKSYQGSRYMVVSAMPRSTTPNPTDILEQKLYTVGTGIAASAPPDLDAPAPNSFWPNSSTVDPVVPAGQMTLILDSQDYQNLKFDLSPDGQVVVVQRVNRRNAGDFGPWMLKLDQKGAVSEAPHLLSKQPGGDFLITPDSNSLAITQGEGLALLPLQPQAEALDFLPKFGMVLSFAADGTQAAMVKFNKDYTRSLFLVTNQGVQKELVKIRGSILKAEFDPQKQVLYCLLTKLLPGETYQEQPYIGMVDLKTGKLTPWVALPIQQGIQMDLAPDGLAILIDQSVTADTPPSGLRNIEGKTIATSRLWLLPIVSSNPETQIKVQPENLPLAGFYPRWLP